MLFSVEGVCADSKLNVLRKHTTQRLALNVHRQSYVTSRYIDGYYAFNAQSFILYHIDKHSAHEVNKVSKAFEYDDDARIVRKMTEIQKCRQINQNEGNRAKTIKHAFQRKRKDMVR